MRKRIGVLGLALALVLTLICPALAAGGKAEFVVTGPEGAVKAGETFTVTVELKDNPGFNAIGFTLAYDKEKMTCTAAKEGVLVRGMLSVTNPNASKGAIVTGASVERVEGDGALGDFTFTAKEDLEKVTFGLTGINLSDENGQAIPYAAENEVIEQTDDPTAGTNPSPSGGTTSPGGAVSPGWTTEPGSGETTPAATGETIPEDLPTFQDTKGHWGELFVGQAAKMGLFKGYTDGRFGPDDPVTRAQFVTVLYRMADSPAVSGETPFTDIADQLQEFQNAILWGYSNGYINGKGPATFDPAGQITRQEAMKILFLYAGGQSGGEVLLTSIYDGGFTDSGDVASWAKAAMYWGVYNEIISGSSSTTLSPQGKATRAQLAKILVNYVDTTKE